MFKTHPLLEKLIATYTRRLNTFDEPDDVIHFLLEQGEVLIKAIRREHQAAVYREALTCYDETDKRFVNTVHALLFDVQTDNDKQESDWVYRPLE